MNLGLCMSAGIYSVTGMLMAVTWQLSFVLQIAYVLNIEIGRDHSGTQEFMACPFSLQGADAPRSPAFPISRTTLIASPDCMSFRPRSNSVRGRWWVMMGSRWR